MDTDQVRVLPGRQLEPGRWLGRGDGGEGQAIAQRETGVDATAVRAAAPHIGHLVREQVAQPRPLEPGYRVRGEFLQEKHVDTAPPHEADDRLLRGTPG